MVEQRTKHRKPTPDHKVPQTDYLGILIEGPRLVGHYFHATWSTSGGEHEAPTLEGTDASTRSFYQAIQYVIDAAPSTA